MCWWAHTCIRLMMGMRASMPWLPDILPLSGKSLVKYKLLYCFLLFLYIWSHALKSLILRGDQLCPQLWSVQSLVGDWGRKVVFGLFQLLLQEELVLFLPLALSNNVSSPLYQPAAAAAAAVKLLLWSEVLVVNSHQGALLLLIHWFFCCWRRHTDCKVSTRNKILEGGMSWLRKRPWNLAIV